MSQKVVILPTVSYSLAQCTFFYAEKCANNSSNRCVVMCNTQSRNQQFAKLREERDYKTNKSWTVSTAQWAGRINSQYFSRISTHTKLDMWPVKMKHPIYNFGPSVQWLRRVRTAHNVLKSIKMSRCKGHLGPRSLAVTFIEPVYDIQDELCQFRFSMSQMWHHLPQQD